MYLPVYDRYYPYGGSYEDYYDEEYYNDEYVHDKFTRAGKTGKKVCTSSDKDKKLLANIKHTLYYLQNHEHALNEIGNASSDNQFFCCESSFNSESIHVTVEGVGELEFPLESNTIEKITSVSSKAKFGKGSETLLDLEVRDTQMIPAAKLKVDIDEGSLTAVVQEISTGLSIHPSCTLIPHLFNMLIYGPDQFFTAHTDSEKIENMVATLVVILPSFYQGGELVINHNDKKHTFTSSDDPNKIKCIAFYSDCYHSIKKVTDGFRVVLTYNVELKPPSAINDILSTIRVDSDLNKCVVEYFDGPDRPKKLMYLLNHAYSEHSLKWYLLKGTDRIQACALYLVAKSQNLVPCLALVVDEEFAVEYEKKMSTVKMRYLVGEDSKILLATPAFPLEFGHDREICYTVKSERLWREFEYFGHGFNGNEATHTEYRYHRACVVLCDASLISSATTNSKMKLLTSKVIAALEELPQTESDGESAEVKPEVRKNQVQKTVVEGTLPSSEVLISIQNEGNLSYPLSNETVQKLISMSNGEKDLEQHAISPNLVHVEIKDQVWYDIISNISSGLSVNAKCTLVPNFVGVQFYDNHNPRVICKRGWYKCIVCSNLCHSEFCHELKVERGDITLIIIMPGLSKGNLSIGRYEGDDQPFTVSDWDKLTSVKYIACYSVNNINIQKRKGAFIYLLYRLELQAELDMQHDIDTTTVDEPLMNAVKKYFSDDSQPKKLIYLLNQDYSEKNLRWHMLKGSDETEGNALYAVAKEQSLVPFLAYMEVKEHWSEAFDNAVTETDVKFLFLIDQHNLVMKPESDGSYLVTEGEVCFTMKNKNHSNPTKKVELSLRENIYYYNRACVVIFAK